MKNFDIANMMGCWDRSLDILIDHLRECHPDIALQRLYEMKRVLHKEMGYLKEEQPVSPQGMPPHGAIV